jgi:hypothetical protein
VGLWGGMSNSRLMYDKCNHMIKSIEGFVLPSSHSTGITKKGWSARTYRGDLGLERVPAKPSHDDGWADTTDDWITTRVPTLSD